MCHVNSLVIHLFFADDSSTLTSQRDDCNRSRKPGKGRPKCDHCAKLGHKIDRCYALHGYPPCSATVAQIDPPSQSSIVDPPSSDHTTSNQSLFSFLFSLDNLPSVTMANGFRVLVPGVGTVDLFPFLSIDNVFCLEFPF